MEKFSQKNTFRRSIDFSIEKINQSLKENREYKINLYNVILADIFIILSYFIFYQIYQNLANDFLNWSSTDFFIYLILMLSISKIRHSFCFKFLLKDILKGNINSYLTKPIPTFLFLSFGNGAVFITFFILVIFNLIIIFLYFENNILLILFLFIFSIFFEIIFHNFLFSLSFIIRNDFISQIFLKIAIQVERLTPKPFEKSLLFNFLILLPIIVGGFFIIEISKNNLYVLDYFKYVLLVFFFLLFLTIILWKYGLKKYNAYG